MDHPLRLEPVELAARPWRLAALAIGAVAAVELVLLVVAGGALLARDDAAPAASAPKRASATPTSTSTSASAAAKHPARARSAGSQPRSRSAATRLADLPRRRVTVVVLNGNGRTGAAAAAASRVSRRGYRIGVVGNAGSHDYPRSIVMYRRGFASEGKRLARDLGIPIVSPLDGIRPAQLDGAHAVLVLGA